ncbi:MAG: transcriptional regulator [Gammaproteobacteria bacterium HGW-Gammaproteobacteria-11]|jgi:DNA-binding protein H-NS|nr:MAG: transcriptional regulator [Gammaproteobacteria bacterium HGW-Gammaproteobacteria-11]
MSQLAQYRALQREISELEEKQRKMQANSKLAREIEFEEEIKALIDKYDMNMSEVLQILSPQDTPALPGTRKARKVKRYKNPHTGEVIETKGGNQKTLKAWKEEHGSDVVEAWVE